MQQEDELSSLPDVVDWLTSTPMATQSIERASTTESTSAFHEPAYSQRTNDSSSELDSLCQFKKMPALNQAFAKRRNSGKLECVCKGCEKTYKNTECSRLLKHVRECAKLTDDIKHNLLLNFDETFDMEITGLQEMYNLLWAEFLVVNNISLRSLKSPTMIKWRDAVCPHWTVDSRHIYTYKHIPKIANRVKKMSLSAITSGGKMSLSVEFDHWQDSNRRSLLGVILTYDKGSRYLVDLQDVSLDGHKHEVVVDGLKKALRFTEKAQINAIISDSAGPCKKAREKIVEDPEFRHVIQHRCIAHLLNRMGNEFTTRGHLKGVIEWATKVASIVIGSTVILSKMKSNGLSKVSKACPVRWYSTVNMLESLLEAKAVIAEEVESWGDICKKSLIFNEVNWKIVEEAIKVLRPLANCIAQAERSNGTLGEAVKSILEFAKLLFTSELDDPLMASAMDAFLKYFGLSKLGEFEFGLLLASYILDRRNNHNYITQNGFDCAFKTIAAIAFKTNVEIKDGQILADEYNNYTMLRGSHATKMTESQSAHDWWSNAGGAAMLEKTARRITSLRSSSANIERTFSTLKYIQSSRYNLSLDGIIDMARIRLFYKEASIEPAEIERPIEINQDVCNSGEIEIDDDDLIENLEPNPTEVVCQTSSLSNISRGRYLAFLRMIDFTLIPELEDTSEVVPVVTVDDALLDNLVQSARDAKSRLQQLKRGRFSN